MKYDLDSKKSFLWSSLLEFGEEVFIENRKKLNLSQKYVAHSLGLNQSEISRLERGVTKPKDIATVEALCELYKLTPSQKSKYLELTFGVPIYQSNDVFSNLLENQIESIADLNRSGSPLFAIRQAQNLNIWVENNVNLKDQSNQTVINKLSILMLEESAAWWDVVTPNHVANHTDKLIEKMEKFASLNNSDNISNICIQINKGFHAYINSDYINAKKYFDSITNAKLFNNRLWNEEVLRANIVTHGKLKDYKALANFEKSAYKQIHDTTIDNTSKGYLLEGLGRAYTELDSEKSQDFFEMAFKYIQEARKKPNFMTIRYIQLTRSYLTLLKRLNKGTDDLMKIATPALEETEKGNFMRHKQQILNLL